MEQLYKKRFDFIVKHLEFEISELEKHGEFSERITSHIMARERFLRLFGYSIIFESDKKNLSINICIKRKF